MNTDDNAIHIHIQIKLESETEGSEAHRERSSALRKAAEFIKSDLFKISIWFAKATFTERISLSINKTHFTMRKYIKPVVQH